ncbi:MAG: glycosyltransferase, partial [Vicinamibacterales bacterium]
MTKSPAADVLVVIVSSDDGRWLPACLAALAGAGDQRFDVLVVLNACSDASERACREAARPVETVRLARRCGFAEANNVGIRAALAAGYRYVFLLNPDTRVRPDAIVHLRGFLDGHANYGVAGCFQTPYDEPGWDVPNRWTAETLADAARMGNVPRMEGAWHVVDHYYVQGSSLMLRADLVPRIGMLDPLYGTFYEETDLCRRCALAGYGVAIVLDARLRHAEGGHWRSSPARRRGRDVLFLRNQFIYFMSARPGVGAALRAAAGVLLRQLRGVPSGEHEVTLRWWSYPRVLAQVLPALRFVPRLQR